MRQLKRPLHRAGRLGRRGAAAIALLALSGCGGSPAGNGLSQAAALGAQIFQDRSLSASGAQACSTCHNPNNAHAQVNNLAVQLGGQNLDQHGLRAPPSLRYAGFTPAAAFDAGGNPVGGFDRDGRAASLAEQAQGPLLASFEMANASVADLVGRLSRADYADQFKQTFGAAVFDSPELAFSGLQYALQQYQIEAQEFHPYDSKYDLYLAGRVPLSDAEMHGLALFNDPGKGNCAACHPSTGDANGAAPLFTNFRYGNLGIPRNPAIPANAAVGYFDLGVCGPLRTDLSTRPTLCGSFKVPTLRNVATRKVFFHNGAFGDLTQAVTFLVRRDTDPTLWYPVDGNGTALKFNDLPLTIQANVDTVTPPFNRQAGMAPALSSDEINDLVAFLGTLSDGYTPQSSP
ncbi:MAG: c-type cytochrome [Burkholderiaceae bacterium]|nr:c-type cytochrome [Burkholderiaceae bacterium]